MGNSLMSLVSQSSPSPGRKMKNGRLTAFSAAVLEKVDVSRTLTHTPAVANFDVSRTHTPGKAKAKAAFSVASIANRDKEYSAGSQTSIDAKSPQSKKYPGSMASYANKSKNSIMKSQKTPQTIKNNKKKSRRPNPDAPEPLPPGTVGDLWASLRPPH